MSTPSRTLSRAALAAALLAIATFACSGDDDQGTGDQGATLPDGSPDASLAGSPDGSLGTSPDASPDGSASPVIKFVFVVAMENHDADAIIGNTDDAPYINGTLVPSYAMSSNFNDELPMVVPSEPHYVWMEAGTNAFADHTFTSDNEPSATNSTSSTSHLAAQIQSTGGRVTWLAYQEGIDDTSGACPIHASGFYQPKHDPFIFFQDVSGSPPSETNAGCAEHHKELSALAGDLAAGSVASYNFITPDQCHDMHGQLECLQVNNIRAGDDWLSQNLPPIIDFANANSGVIFLTWDEGEDTSQMPFLAIGPGVKPGFAGDVAYNHGSLLKSVEQILQLPVLATVESATDLSDLFQPGLYP